MPNVEYSSKLAKKDPLTTQHVKVPSSIIPIFAREAEDNQRAISFLMREALIAKAQQLTSKHEAADRAAKLISRRKAS